ncbi:tmcB, partial [Acrasis kona]
DEHEQGGEGVQPEQSSDNTNQDNTTQNNDPSQDIDQLREERERRYVPNPIVTFYKNEESAYIFIYEMYFNLHDAADRFPKRILKSGFINLISLFFFYLQILSLILLPSMMWTKSARRIYSVISVFRNLHLQPLINSLAIPYTTQPNSLSDNFETLQVFSDNASLCHFLNFYLPFLASCAITLTSTFLIYITYRFKTRRRGFFMYIYHLHSQILPALFIPTISGFLNTTTCYNAGIHSFETLPESCFSFPNVFLPLISFIMLAPFLVSFAIITNTCFEWRMDVGNVCARPHSRFDASVYVVAGLMTAVTTYFEFVPIVSQFFNFASLLLIIVLHVYFMTFYKTLTNALTSIMLFVCLFASMVSIMIATFMLFFESANYFDSEFPNSVVLSCSLLSLGLGYGITALRLYVINVLVTDPRPLMFFQRLNPNDVVVPRGEFEVEMADRTVDWVAGFHASLTTQDDAPSREQGEQHVRIQLHEMRSIDRVDEMYKNAIDHIHSTSVFVFLSYATFLIHVARQRGRALHLLETIEHHYSILWMDFRMHFYVRRKYWLEVVFPEMDRLEDDRRQRRQEQQQQQADDFVN